MARCVPAWPARSQGRNITPGWRLWPLHLGVSNKGMGAGCGQIGDAESSAPPDRQSRPGCLAQDRMQNGPIAPGSGVPVTGS